MSQRVVYCRVELVVQATSESAYEEARGVAENLRMYFEATDKAVKVTSVQPCEWAEGYRLFYGL